MSEMIKCDMCGSKIIEGKCSCGTWKSKEEMEGHPFKIALEHFHEMKQFTMTGDAPHLGRAFVFFRGDYNDCKKVEQLIYQMKDRPFYGEKNE
tara:strand:+ start:948 stop:1226 length:279 start_codon:yes stop_codon:yes gene_type:complete